LQHALTPGKMSENAGVTYVCDCPLTQIQHS
jgi:hypothetical protein